jgi:hypothetical protein
MQTIFTEEGGQSQTPLQELWLQDRARWLLLLRLLVNHTVSPAFPFLHCPAFFQFALFFFIFRDSLSNLRGGLAATPFDGSYISGLCFLVPLPNFFFVGRTFDFLCMQLLCVFFYLFLQFVTGRYATQLEKASIAL